MMDNGKMEIDNSKLETASEEFAKDRTKENFVNLMELIEKAVVYMPSLPPENMDEESLKSLKEGKGVKLPKDAKIMPCLLKKSTGEQVLPIFSSGKHIPKDGRNPVILAVPFFTCVAMVMANSDKVESVVLNPFTHNINIPKQILEVAHKRKTAPTKTVKVTEAQFHQLAHSRIAFELLPVFLYEKQEEGLKQLQKEAGEFLLSLYTSIYPKEIKAPYSEEDFSVMTLNVTDDIQITRIDMPEKNIADGLCIRVYAVWKREAEAIEYYTIERTGNGNNIGRVYADRNHTVIEPAPDNGVEIERIMSLASESPR